MKISQLEARNKHYEEELDISSTKVEKLTDKMTKYRRLLEKSKMKMA